MIITVVALLFQELLVIYCRKQVPIPNFIANLWTSSVWFAIQSHLHDMYGVLWTSVYLLAIDTFTATFSDLSLTSPVREHFVFHCPEIQDTPNVMDILGVLCHRYMLGLSVSWFTGFYGRLSLL